MLLVLLAACCVPLDFSSDAPETDAGPQEEPVAPVAPPARLGSAASSAAARPGWELDHNDAPQADEDILALAATVEPPVAEGVLACTVTSFLREERLLQRHQAPDLEASVRWGDRAVSLSGPDNVDSLTVTAPLAVLDPAQAITVTTWDRQIFRTRKLASVALAPSRLPLEVDADSVRTRCSYVPRDRLEPLVGPALEQAATHSRAWKPSVDLDADGVAPDGSGAAAQAALRRAASMVGWDDPRVVRGVALFDKPYQRYLSQLRTAIGKKVAGVGPGWSDAGEIQWSPARLVRQGNMATEWPAGAASTWGVAVPVRPQAEGQQVTVMSSDIGSLQGLQLVDGQGGPWVLTVAGTAEPASFDMAPTVSGPTTLMFTPAGDGRRIEPVEPLLLRARMEDGWLFQRVE